MAQADYVVANDTGAAVRSDLNGQLAAIVSNNSGATEPATMYAYQWWADTTTGLLKLRNSANSAWIELRQLDGEFTTVPVEDGSAGAPSIYFKTSGTDTGLYSPGADQVGISTGGTARVIVDSNGATLNGQGDLRFADSDSSHFIALQAPATITTDVTLTLPSADGTSGQFISTDGSGTLSFATPASGASNLADGSAATPSVNYSADTNTGIFRAGNDLLAFSTGGTERARFDDSGRLLVGTPSSVSVLGENKVQLFGENSGGSLSLTRTGATTQSANLVFGRTRGDASTRVSLNNDDVVGRIYFVGDDGTDIQTPAALIQVNVDGTPGANSMPGRIVLSTTASGASSPTERMRIANNGSVFIAKTAVDRSVFGVQYEANGFVLGLTSDDTRVLEINRQSNDGDLVQFFQANTLEGTISVSGSTVAYNGAHLSRWSQIPGIDPHDKDARPEILRGTVMSNLDEMCDWIDPETDEPQANEQLNKTKISDVEGDKNVAGIFQSWDDDDDTWVNDYYLAMTGDFIIRIAEGVTVKRGDLLMSAGDGTAKPQDDDIIRSKTIAKVTSTNVSCTYEDGSYCVPCVLMAC
jgi:hypothetical protein